jgi:uncharacterized repeat protein (TIGR03803 family)
MSNYLASTMLAAAAVAALTVGSGAQAQVHQFTGNPDGEFPHAKLLSVNCGSTNYVYGTTQYGGAFGEGVVFNQQISPPGPETVIYTFTGAVGAGGQPTAGLIQVGNYLYGTTQVGGLGTVYRIPVGTCGPAAQTVLWTFTGSPDGQVPAAGLLYHDGLLYGTTVAGGTYGLGTIFRCKLTGPCQVIYSFAGGPGDGENPYGGLIFDSTASGGVKLGALYGTTQLGGTFGQGTVFNFEISPALGPETVMYNFAGGTDGAYPEAELLKHGQDLYSTTFQGGALGNCTSGCGTVFKIGPSFPYPYAVTHRFAGYPTDGANPIGGLVWDTAATPHEFYGTTFLGGSATPCMSGSVVSGCGTEFHLKANGTGEGVSINFNNVSNGIWPAAGLILDGGTLYGTTIGGVLGGDGTLF